MLVKLLLSLWTKPHGVAVLTKPEDVKFKLVDSKLIRLS